MLWKIWAKTSVKIYVCDKLLQKTLFPKRIGRESAEDEEREKQQKEAR